MEHKQKQKETSKLQLRFELAEISATTVETISQIHRLSSDRNKSFMLNFQTPTSKRVFITTCNGCLEDYFFVLKKHSKHNLNKLTRFNLAVSSSKAALECHLDCTTHTLTCIFVPDDESAGLFIEKIWKTVH